MQFNANRKDKRGSLEVWEQFSSSYALVCLLGKNSPPFDTKYEHAEIFSQADFLRMHVAFGSR